MSEYVWTERWAGEIALLPATHTQTATLFLEVNIAQAAVTGHPESSRCADIILERLFHVAMQTHIT